MKESIVQVTFVDGTVKSFEQEGDSLVEMITSADNLAKLLKLDVANLKVRVVDEKNKVLVADQVIAYMPAEILTK